MACCEECASGLPCASVTTGTRVSWSSVGEWVEARREILGRKISSARHAAQREHLAALPDAMVARASAAELDALEGVVRDELPGRGSRAGHPSVRLLDAIDRRRAALRRPRKLTVRRVLAMLVEHVRRHLPEGVTGEDLDGFVARHREELEAAIVESGIVATPVPEYAVGDLVKDRDGEHWLKIGAKWKSVRSDGRVNRQNEATAGWLHERGAALVARGVSTTDTRAAMVARHQAMHPTAVGELLWRTGRPLIIACSATKKPGRMPAREKYDGPLWRTYRAHGDGFDPRRVFALSAKYGLIRADMEIDDYDQRVEDAAELAGKVAEQAWEWHITEVDFVGGELYAEVLRRAGVGVNRVGSGGIGEMRRGLAAHLKAAAPSL